VSDKQRLDLLVVERGLAPTRAKAQALILAGRIYQRQSRLDKPGVRLDRQTDLELRPGPRFVSRGGLKLDPVLDRFGVSAAGRDALDVGASTGGFTHVLLSRKAARVIALDVGRGQLDWTLRNDARVHVVEGINARNLEVRMLPFVPAVATVDVSFISLKLVLPAVIACLAEDGEAVVLIKPQFEVGRENVGRGGIVRDPTLHRHVLEELTASWIASGWPILDLCASPLPGAEGNREFFAHLRRNGTGLDAIERDRRIGAAVDEAWRGAG
jgi:23S rRNA (cytidine1920-2'-O)/16S rRNA (cytidine1409-2'-O)-methyltransferase